MRLALVVLAIEGPGILIYLISWLVVPRGHCAQDKEEADAAEAHH